MMDDPQKIGCRANHIFRRQQDVWKNVRRNSAHVQYLCALGTRHLASDQRPGETGHSTVQYNIRCGYAGTLWPPPCCRVTVQPRADWPVRLRTTVLHVGMPCRYSAFAKMLMNQHDGGRSKHALVHTKCIRIAHDTETADALANRFFPRIIESVYGATEVVKWGTGVESPA